MRPSRLICPACSSRGVRSTADWRPFDALYRIVGRVPYACLWCGKRCYLVPPEKTDTGPAQIELPARPAPVVARETAVLHPPAKPTATPPAKPAENGHLHLEKNGDGVSKPAKVVIESVPAPVLSAPIPRVEVAIPDSPPMYAANGRLRLSGITLEQIQRRDHRIRRPAAARNTGDTQN